MNKRTHPRFFGRFLVIFVVFSMIQGGTGMFEYLFGEEAQQKQWVNYDEAKVPRFKLPEALKMKAGTPVTTPAQWRNARRGELLALFADQMFGKLPAALREAGNHPDFVSFSVVDEDMEALGGKAIRRQVAIFFCPPGGVSAGGDDAVLDETLETEDGDGGEDFTLGETCQQDAPRAAVNRNTATGPVGISEDVETDAQVCQVANLLIYIPKNAAGPVPVMLGPNFNGNHTISDDPGVFMSDVFDKNENLITDETNIPEEKRRGGSKSRWAVEKILDAGFAVATIYYQDIAPDDNNTCFRKGVFGVYGAGPARKVADAAGENSQKAGNPDALRDGNSWGAISAWAWGMSRAMDYLETDEIFDAKKVVLMGHSRLGKTALWAGACDERFAIVVSNNSGCGGAALSRREYGERVERINRAFPHWFCMNFRPYGDNVNALPFDQHELIALIAPRPIYIASAEEDRWADPYGEFLGGFYAAEVYKLLGTDGFGSVTNAAKLPPLNTSVGGTIGYHIRTGVHDVTDFDWDQYIRFAKKHFRMK